MRVCMGGSQFSVHSLGPHESLYGDGSQFSVHSLGPHESLYGGVTVQCPFSRST